VSVEIREVDPGDEAELHRWWRTTDDAMSGRPCPGLNPTWETQRAAFTTPHPDFRQALLTAYDDGEAVGTVIHVLPLTDNLKMSYADVTVPERHRRRGVGTALLAAAESRSREAGRSYLVVEVVAPLGEVSAGERFAEAHGYPVANREGIKVLDLHDHPDWAPLAQRAAERGAAYRIVEWGATTPEDLVPAVCEALNVFIGMVPLGDLALEDIVMTPERLRRNEERSLELGRRRFCAAALAPDGSLAGYSDLSVPPHADHRAEIGLTMVLPEHRGHALGLATKLATHASLLAAVPTCATVSTDNSDANEHMNAVNEQMGYRLVEQLLEVQKEL
jgi:GNAT superfamily N-acetyltransferase